MTREELLRYFPAELKNLNFRPNQDGLDSLLQKVGERVDAFFHSFPDAASKESVLLERLKANGKVEVSIKQNYDYLVLVYPDQGGIRLEEDRNDLKDQPLRHKGISGYCLTSGYVGTPILFLPRRQAGSSFRYLGRQSSEPFSHVIAFAQKPGVENAISSFRTDARSKSTPMLYQGLIWVDPQTHEIVRMRTDLLAPMPDINLTSHTTEVSFGEVRFNSISQVFWLPQKVTVTIRWKGKIFRNLHRYSDYRLFSVKSYNIIAQPQTKK